MRTQWECTAVLLLAGVSDLRQRTMLLFLPGCTYTAKSRVYPFTTPALLKRIFQCQWRPSQFNKKVTLNNTSRTKRLPQCNLQVNVHIKLYKVWLDSKKPEIWPTWDKSASSLSFCSTVKLSEVTNEHAKRKEIMENSICLPIMSSSNLVPFLKHNSDRKWVIKTTLNAKCALIFRNCHRIDWLQPIFYRPSNQRGTTQTKPNFEQPALRPPPFGYAWYSPQFPTWTARARQLRLRW